MLESGFTGFAVFDLETTGRSPSKHHRVIEIGIVRLDEDLDIVEEWETLINPDRDVGAYDLHGITASDLKGAPRFQELLADIWHRFEGAIPVSHNYNFDKKFLVHEFAKAGIDIGDLDGLCTMRLASQFGIGNGSRKLIEICNALSLPVDNCHSAGHDAKMSSEILRIASQEIDLSKLAQPASCPELWKRKATPLGITRQKVRESPIQSPLQRMASELDGSSISSTISRHAIDEYLLVLDRVLEDLTIDEEEVDELIAFAANNGLASKDIAKIHQEYISNLVALVLSDGIVTDDERRDLMRVSGLLGIEEHKVNRLLKDPPKQLRLKQDDFSGKSVCFTGTSRCSIDGDNITKEAAKNFATNAGMITKSGVSKALDILVVCDPDTASGKAKKARDYGTRIIAERIFWQKIGISVD